MDASESLWLPDRTLICPSCEPVARSWLQLLSKPILQSVLLPQSAYCLFQHCFNVSLSSCLLLQKGQKPHSSCSIVHLSSPSSSNHRRDSALRASSRKWLRLWNLSLILSTVPLLENWRRVFASSQRKKWWLWLIGDLILIDLGYTECNHWWWIFTKGSARWVKVQWSIKSSEISWIC